MMECGSCGGFGIGGDHHGYILMMFVFFVFLRSPFGLFT